MVLALPGAPPLLRAPAAVLAALLVMTLLLRRRGESLSSIGLVRRPHWGATLALAAGGWIAVTLLATLVAQPIARGALGGPPDISRFDFIAGNFGAYLAMLALAWSSAAFGEEVLFRGFLLRRLADLIGGGGRSWHLAALAQAVLFGALHAYQGPGGMFLTGFVGYCLGLLFLLARRNLWVPILAHGLIDTTSLSAIHFGLVHG